MIYLFSFEGLREIEESRYRLPQKLIVQSFEEGFLLQGRMEYLFEQPEDYEIFSGDIDRIVLEKWQPVMEDVLYDMEETPKLVFFAESDRRLFLSMKSKFRMHIGAWEYYSLESLLQLADLEENKSEFRCAAWNCLSPCNGMSGLSKDREPGHDPGTAERGIQDGGVGAEKCRKH